MLKITPTCNRQTSWSKSMFLLTRILGINTADTHIVKSKVCIWAKWPIRPELIPVSLAWSDWEYFYSPLDGMLVHRRVTPSIKFASSRLYTWVERGTVRVKCLAQRNPDRLLQSRAHSTSLVGEGSRKIVAFKHFIFF